MFLLVIGTAGCVCGEGVVNFKWEKKSKKKVVSFGSKVSVGVNKDGVFFHNRFLTPSSIAVSGLLIGGFVVRIFCRGEQRWRFFSTTDFCPQPRSNDSSAC